MRRLRVAESGTPRIMALLVTVVLTVMGCATPGADRSGYIKGSVAVAIVAPSGDVYQPDSYTSDGITAGATAVLIGLALAPLTFGSSFAQGVNVGPAAVIRGTMASSCAEELQAAYPRLSEQFAAAIKREFSTDDLAAAFIRVLRARTAGHVFPVETASTKHLLTIAAREGIDNLIGLEPKQVLLMVSNVHPCEYTVAFHIEGRLWQRNRTKPEGPAEYRGRPISLPPFKAPELEHLLSHPGALRARFVSIYKGVASNMVTGWELKFENQPKFR